MPTDRLRSRPYHGDPSRRRQAGSVLVLVVALLVALLQMGVLVNVQPAAGALAFAGGVICTMLAALSFDRRLLWPR